MKILEVIPLLSVNGGAESFVVYFCNELIKQGHVCAILTLYNVPQEVISQLNLFPTIKLFTANKKKGLDVGCSFKVLDTIRKYRPDVVHVHVGAIPYMTLSSVLYTKCKYFATIHNEAKIEAGKGYAKLSRKFLFNTRKAKPITISDQSKESFTDYYHLNSEMIYNGVPEYVDNIHKDNIDITTFIHVARCHPIKNQELLLKSFHQLTQKYEDIELYWYGDNNEYKSLFQTYGHYFSDKIKFCGSVKDARQVMCKADAFCLTSKMEGMPMTIIEALSVGCVPIVTSVGGCVNMIKDGLNGFLSQDLTVESYCNAIERYLSLSIEERERMKEEAIKSYKENFSIASTVEKYIDVFSR